MDMEMFRIVSDRQSMSATVDSWGVEYVGIVHDLLYEHIASYSTDKDKWVYTKYLSIVQSSGMGKSRAIDELSKKHLVVPLNLRQGSSGFPPPDRNVRDWLLQSATRMEALTRSGAFLYALFVTLLHYLEHIDDKIAAIPSVSNDTSLAARFRFFMTTGQTFSNPGPTRTQFYDEILQLAEEIRILQPPSTPYDAPLSFPNMPLRTTNAKGEEVKYDLNQAVKNLMELLVPGFDVLNTYPPALIISFDEAHTLSKIEDGGPWSRLAELRRALGIIRIYPCVSVFISTSFEIMPQPRVSEGFLRWIPSFCALGFDQLAEKAISGETTLDKVTSRGFIASLSRPLFATRFKMGDNDIKRASVLFAGEKLLCKSTRKNLEIIEKLACISVRIPVEFSKKSRSQEMERILVQKHMRVCLHVDPESGTAVTVAPSEPILAQASYNIMNDPSSRFDLPRTLSAAIQYSGVDRGMRGELIGAMLCLMARDAATKRLYDEVTPVCDFIRELLVPSCYNEVLHSTPVLARTLTEATKTFEDTFCNSNIFFSHFVRVHDSRAINREYLWRLIARGAAALCVDFSFSIVIPFLFWDRCLQRKNVSAFVLRCTNDAYFQAKPRQHLFDCMNPYAIHLFDENETDLVPVIRMVFALASSTPGVVVLQRPEALATQPAAGDMVQFQADEYTTFDIWCAKASRETFLPVREDYLFNELVRESRFDVFESKRTEGLRNATRSMVPLAGVHPAHWGFLESQVSSDSEG